MCYKTLVFLMLFTFSKDVFSNNIRQRCLFLNDVILSRLSKLSDQIPSELSAELAEVKKAVIESNAILSQMPSSAPTDYVAEGVGPYLSVKFIVDGALHNFANGEPKVFFENNYRFSLGINHDIVGNGDWNFSDAPPGWALASLLSKFPSEIWVNDALGWLNEILEIHPKIHSSFKWIAFQFAANLIDTNPLIDSVDIEWFVNRSFAINKNRSHYDPSSQDPFYALINHSIAVSLHEKWPEWQALYEKRFSAMKEKSYYYAEKILAQDRFLFTKRWWQVFEERIKYINTTEGEYRLRLIATFESVLLTNPKILKHDKIVAVCNGAAPTFERLNAFIAIGGKLSE